MENRPDSLPKNRINKFANDYNIEKSLQRIWSFGLFHKCRLRCYNNPKREDSEACSKKCEMDLDSFFKYDLDNKVELSELALVNHNPESFKSDEDYQDYQKSLVEMEGMLLTNSQITRSKLEDWQEALKSRKFLLKNLDENFSFFSEGKAISRVNYEQYRVKSQTNNIYA